MKKGWLILVLSWAFVFCKASEYERFVNYETLFSQAMQQANLPENFCYLPLLLTECNPLYDNGLAVGLWGLSAPVAAHYGLKMTYDYDERLNPVLATQAAAAYLADLQKLYDTDKALQLFSRCALHGKLSPAKDSLKSALQNCFLLDQMDIDYRLNAKNEALKPFEPKKLLTITENVAVGDFCNNLEMSEQAFRSCNTALKPQAEILRKGYRVILPENIENQQLLAVENMYRNALPDSVLVAKLPVSDVPAPMPEFVVYRVKQGDTLGHIAQKYHVSVAQIKRWNHLRSDMLQVGQKLKIYKKL